MLVAVVFCVTLFSPPLAALVRNPSKPLPWLLDGDPWNDADSDGDEDIDSAGDQGVVVPSFFRLHTSKYFMIYFVPKTVKKDDAIDKDDSAGFTDIERSREASSR